jgi:hypothetical protein
MVGAAVGIGFDGRGSSGFGGSGAGSAVNGDISPMRWWLGFN